MKPLTCIFTTSSFATCWAMAWVLLTPIQGWTNLPFGFAALAIAVVFASSWPVHYGLSSHRCGGWAMRLVSGILLAASLAVVQWVVVIPAYLWWAAATNAAPWLDVGMAHLLAALGADCALQNGVIYLQTKAQVMPIHVGWEKLDLYMFTTLAVAVVWCGWWRGGWRAMPQCGVVLLLLIAYAIVRTVLLLLIYADIPQALRSADATSMFFSWQWRVGSYLPLPLLLWLGCRRAESSAAEECPDSGRSDSMKRRAIISSVLVMMMLCLITVGLSPLRSHPQTAVSVLIDDYHSGHWETAHVPFTRESFGGEHLYNYWTMQRWLANDYHVDINVDKTIDQLDLGTYSTVIIKTPNVKFTEGEVRALRTFVEQGGGALFIGDHTDLLGMGTNMNHVLQPWGVAFNADSCNQLSTGFISTFAPAWAAPQPLLRGIDRFEFLTSCSLTFEAHRGSCVIPGYDLFADHGDYGNRNFFGDMKIDGSESFGVLGQCYAGEVGAGRIIVFADSTVFSNFCFYVGNHDRFISNCIDYLSRERSPLGVVRPWLLAVATLCGLAAALLLAGMSRWHLPLTVMFCLLAYRGIELASCARLDIGTATIASAPRDIAFVREDSWANFPPVIGVEDRTPEFSYNSLYCYPQRLGLSTTMSTTWEEACTSGAKCISLINPTDPFLVHHGSEATAWVAKGGDLLVFLGANSIGDNAHIAATLSGTTPADKAGKLIDEQTITNKGTVRVRSIACGAGTLTLVWDGHLLADGIIGHPMAKPEEDQLRLYSLLGKIFHH